MTSQNTALDIWLSGAIAVVTVDFLVYPFDTLKTRIQSPAYSTVYKDAATNKIKKNVLFRGLYQGVVSVVASTIPASGAFFTTYESVKSALNKTKSSSSSSILQSIPNPAINAVASCAGESVSCLLLTPAEVIKQNAQVINTDINTSNKDPSKGMQSPKRKGSVTLQVLKRFKHHPWRLFSGYTALLGRNLPFTGLNFPMFEGIKGYLVERRRRKLGYSQHPPGTSGPKAKAGDQGKGGEEPVYERAVLTGIAASISGSIASVITTPIDVVKTRMMLAASDSSSSSSSASQGRPEPGSNSGTESSPKTPNKKEGNVFTVGRQIFQDEGMRGLFRGGAIRVVWTAVALSIYLSMYEGGRFYLEKRRARKTESEE
ncbi:mitochondrial carrier [Aspergillus unguis]